MNHNLDVLEADKAPAVAVLHGIHECMHVTAQKVDVLQVDNRVSVIAAAGRQQLFDEAMQFLHTLLLQDLRPPWLGHQFPQALPGEGVLSRFTRPSFLQWVDDAQGKTRALFGNDLSDRVNITMEYMHLEHAGFVARPLYVCTKRIESGEMCMNVASMSKFIQHRDGRSHYRCT